MTDFSIPTNMDEITEDKPVAAGIYDVRIRDARGGDSKKGNPKCDCFLTILNPPEGSTPADVYYCLNYPYPGCHKFLEQEFKRFVNTFGVDVSSGQLLPNDLPGLEATITLEMDTDQNGRACNKAMMNPIPD